MLARGAGLPEARVGEVLDEVDLSGVSSKRVGAYSFGMRQRLALAGALLGDPRILVLDEPANGLDARGIRWLRGLSRDFAARGNTVLVSSHALAEVAESADEVMVLHQGRLLAHTTVEELTSKGAGLEQSFFALIDRKPDGAK
jgi:ABC-2 type transport system ATP-binding protein